MHNVYIKIFLLVCIATLAPSVASQQQPTTLQVDSLSWKFFTEGNWDALIQTGKLAHRENINFKWLQQRLGYAWFMKGDYYKSKKHYQSALSFDKTDDITHLYLYYTNRATGHHLTSRFHASQLPDEIRTQHAITSTRWLNSVDAEYSYKRPEVFFRENDLRGDGIFRRIGLHSYPGYRFSIYQSLSGFQQTTEFGNTTNQLEYMGSISAKLNAPLTVQTSYRYIGTRYTILPDSFFLPGHQLSLRFDYQLNRFDLTLSGARYFNEYLKVQQIGLIVGTGFSLPLPVYLKSAVFLMQEDWTGIARLNPHFVFNQTIGSMIWKNRLWAEVSATTGNQNYFTSADGLYFYNSPDQVQEKYGAQLIAYLNPNLNLSIHYGIEKKYIYLVDEHYYQQALTGGIVWIL